MCCMSLSLSLTHTHQMRHTRRVSVWLVGISGGLRFEGPVCRNGRITGWYTMWGFERAFQIDMAGACNATVSVYSMHIATL